MTREELLKKLYYALKNPAAYAGKSKLFKEVKKHDSNIPIKDVEELLKSQLPYILHKLIRLNFSSGPVMVYRIDGNWQIDLVDMIKFLKHNDGFSLIMLVIDIFYLSIHD